VRQAQALQAQEVDAVQQARQHSAAASHHRGRCRAEQQLDGRQVDEGLRVAQRVAQGAGGVRGRAGQERSPRAPANPGLQLAPPLCTLSVILTPNTVNWCMGGTSSTKLAARLAKSRGKGPEAARHSSSEAAAASSP
jgi:hypothetical protein